ncbi:MAG TPA: TlpA disulfide reductase family protein [Steroidobacteraceae bacterium]|nr:TlpA disulfide reductase family protein [Steroidobacteraceae bacterium]
MRTTHAVLLALGVICLGAAAGFFAAHVLGPPAPSAAPVVASHREAVATSPAGEEPDADHPPQPRTVPSTLPQITLPDMQGTARSLSDWKGHPLVLNFWATWCAPCRREIPLLKRLRQERSAEGVEVIGIAVDFRDAVQRYAREMHIDYPVLIGEQDGLSAISAFGMDTVFPFTVFADGRGRILTLKVGELHPDEARFILDRLLAVDRGALGLPAARREVAEGIARLAMQRARAEAAPESLESAGSAQSPRTADPHEATTAAPRASTSGSPRGR